MASLHKTKYWHELADGRIQCDLCPRACKLHDQQRGLCFVRACVDKQIVLTTYGRSSGFCIDPVEKKPLNHFYPGTSVLSFGTAGCNLSCKFCQNWDISKSRNMDTLAAQAMPETIARAAKKLNCHSVAFTYNDPIIFHEYAIDIAAACHEYDIKTIAVSAGYTCAEPRAEFYQYMDAANIDLKAFNDEFYYRIVGGKLQPVLDTLMYLYHETSVWLEITTLLIPDENDSISELDELTKWVYAHLGADVPIHFSAFHPDWKMRNKPRTPLETLQKARAIAMDNGLDYVYTGNVHDTEGDTTYCRECRAPLIIRDWYQLKTWNLKDGRCPECHTPCSGHVSAAPGSWGAKRQAVNLVHFA